MEVLSRIGSVNCTDLQDRHDVRVDVLVYV